MVCKCISKRLPRNRKFAISSGSIEYSGGRLNSLWMGEMLRNHEEHRLRRQPTKLPLTLMIERVGIKHD